MTKNIKEIGKELMGKSLNSFHRKTGLTQLEKNNEMQDGILNGILSQVDDAYIEKTEQSNVIHLDGSGDGVVVLDGIEGNTMMNLVSINDFINNNSLTKKEHSVVIKRNNESSRHYQYLRVNNLWKENTTYTIVYIVTKNSFTENVELNNNTGIHYDPFNDNDFKNFIVEPKQTGMLIDKLTTKPKSEWNSYPSLFYTLPTYNETNLGEEMEFKMVVLEGDYTDKEINFFEGLQSSFEEKVNDEGKYEIEILSQNANLVKYEDINLYTPQYNAKVEKTSEGIRAYNRISGNDRVFLKPFKVRKNSTVNISFDVKVDTQGSSTLFYLSFLDDNLNKIKTTNFSTKTYSTSFENRMQTFRVGDASYIRLELVCFGTSTGATYKNIMVSESTSDYIPYDCNKIKLLINEPLRGVGDVKDKFVFKDGKLMIERNCREIVLTGNEDWKWLNDISDIVRFYFKDDSNVSNIKQKCLCDRFQYSPNSTNPFEYIYKDTNLIIGIKGNKLNPIDINGFKQWLQQNPTKVVYQLAEPTYEEVLNEYGEPILLEGYENGTIYIDSTIAPTTSVRYTPNMKSINTLKEVSNNNVMLTTDINDTIIPYMMEVDLMIMEKEMSLFNSLNKNIRKVGEEDMTSMQKRTYDMLARLIKGKTLNEQECKTRVTVYLNAGKITDEQAKELNFLIDEIYA